MHQRSWCLTQQTSQDTSPSTRSMFPRILVVTRQGLGYVFSSPSHLIGWIWIFLFLQLFPLLQVRNLAASRVHSVYILLVASSHTHCNVNSIIAWHFFTFLTLSFLYETRSGPSVCLQAIRYMYRWLCLFKEIRFAWAGNGMIGCPLGLGLVVED